MPAHYSSSTKGHACELMVWLAPVSTILGMSDDNDLRREGILCFKDSHNVICCFTHPRHGSHTNAFTLIVLTRRVNDDCRSRRGHLERRGGDVEATAALATNLALQHHLTGTHMYYNNFTTRISKKKPYLLENNVENTMMRMIGLHGQRG